MHVSKYVLLLNSAVKGHLLTRSEQEKKRLREKLEFLENGLWDAGVRVKKLKGVSNKVVFEARLSKSDRLLFTLGKHHHRTAIYLWGVSGHDDVGSTVQRIFPPNAPFLDFEPEARGDLREIIIDDLPPAYFRTEDLETKSLQDCGPQKWLVLTDEQWSRYTVVHEKRASLRCSSRRLSKPK